MNDSKEYILKMAFSLFITKGYKAVTLSDLENATKLTKGAFYHYFKSKEELFFEVIEKYYLNAYLTFEPTEKEQQTLEEFINCTIQFIKNKMLLLRDITNEETPDPYYITLLFEAKKHFPALEEKIKDTFQSQINQWEKAIVHAKNNGEIKSNLESYLLAENFNAIGMSIVKNLLTSESTNSTISKLHLQYEQLYKLIKK